VLDPFAMTSAVILGFLKGNYFRDLLFLWDSFSVLFYPNEMKTSENV